jgi:hypothetical protein
MLVPELMSNCQVSENPKNGPEMPQTTIVPRATTKAHELPAQRLDRFASRARMFSWLDCDTEVDVGGAGRLGTFVH